MEKNTVSLLISLALSIALTGAFIITDKIKGKQRKNLIYIGFFLFILILGYLAAISRLEAEEYNTEKYETVAGPVQLKAR